MLTFKDEELVERLRTQWDIRGGHADHFHAFRDLEENVRHQIQKVRSHPWWRADIPVRRFIYDVRTGALNEFAVGSAVAS